MAASVENLSSAWDIVAKALAPHQTELLPEVQDTSEEILKAAIDQLHQHGLGQIIDEWFIEIFQQDMRQRISPEFWRHFPRTATECAGSLQILQPVDTLHQQITAYFPRIDLLENLQGHIHKREVVKSVSEKFALLLKAILFTQVPLCFHDAVRSFYGVAFKVFHRQEELEQDEDGILKCSGCVSEMSNCQCNKVKTAFHQLNQQLAQLGLLERVAGEAITAVVRSKIQQHVQQICKGNFDTTYLDVLEKWLESNVISWLTLVYQTPQDGSIPKLISQLPESLENYKKGLYHYLYEVCATIRMEQLFHIIIEFPESQSALEDLKSCLERTDLRNQLVKSLKSALETKLLHPGVNTSDILTAYISAIKALRVLDSTGVILELVCEPVRKYLRTREDTVRCIVSSLTDDSSSELSDELNKGEPLLLDETYHSDEEGENWENWTPDPVDADPAKTPKSRRTSDIISMLVNIYGSKELFVNEYRTLLADRILLNFNYDTAREIRYLELLKLRFGEAHLHYCEVMLKDVADSKRINTHIHSEGLQGKGLGEVPVSAMVLSAQFWPTFREEKLQLFDHITKSLDSYTAGFETLKGNRTLNWKPHLGLVNLEIELKEQKLEFNVSPVHASIIMHFEKQNRWTIEELSSAMHMSSTSLRRKITYWQSVGLLKEECQDTFILVEEQRGRNQDVNMIDEDEEAESAMASSHDQREEELQVFWSYIIGMLTNLESLPLERILTMLKMFAMQGPMAVECSMQELRNFLDRKVKEQKLTFSGGVYRLPKNS